MKKHIEKDKCIVDFSQIKQLNNEYFKYTKDKSDLIQRKRYYDSLITFFDWFSLDYYPTVIKPNKEYHVKHLAECIFKEKFKTKREFQEYLFKSIYVAKNYIDYLRNKIREDNIGTYSHALRSLLTDLEWLITKIEFNIKSYDKTLTPSSWRRKDLSPRDIYSAANTLFFIEEFKNIEDLYLRDLKPVVMFQIRQILEVFGRNLLGYDSINDKNGNIIKKFTQISWEFIKEEIKKTNSRIELPFDLSTILLINNWSNSFVHTTYLYSSYIQFFALKTINCLFYSDNKVGIKIYNGKIISCTDFGDIKIKEYNLLKIDFENYLKNKSHSPDILVEWMSLDDVGAYIVSE
jgi:hypothetical protein